jgi:HEAT repeat protein
MNQSRSTVATVLLAFAIGSGLFGLAQAPPTGEQVLASKGISTSSLTSLRQALQDPRPDVRGLAAGELADKKDKESIPLIKQVLAKASSAEEKQNLAQALITLGDPEGNAALKKVCEDETVREDSRIIAASSLVDAGDPGCLDVVVKILTSTDSDAIKQSTMYLLKRGPSVRADLLPDLQQGLEKALKDEVPGNRQLASECLAKFKMNSAIDSLKIAIAIEKDPDIRSQMEENLRKLESKQP